jgi:hypothetical protein
MLLNLVRLRYVEAPVFLDVTSVVNSYTLSTGVGGGLNFADSGNDSQNLRADASYTDRPTVTYSPRRGEAFTRSLLRPIPPASLVALAQAGWPIDFIFSTTVNSINGVSNRFGAAGHPGVERVGIHHRGDIEEDGRLDVAEAHEVQQHLLVCRLGKRVGVVEAITLQDRRADRSAGPGERCEHHAGHGFPAEAGDPGECRDLEGCVFLFCHGCLPSLLSQRPGPVEDFEPSGSIFARSSISSRKASSTALTMTATITDHEGRQIVHRSRRRDRLPLFHPYENLMAPATAQRPTDT